MTNDSSSIVSKVWNYAHFLKNAGVGYGDYVEQITCPLLLRFVGQRQIVANGEACTSNVDHLEAEFDFQMTRSNRLRQSTLASAFRGELI